MCLWKWKEIECYKAVYNKHNHRIAYLKCTAVRTCCKLSSTQLAHLQVSQQQISACTQQSRKGLAKKAKQIGNGI